MSSQLELSQSAGAQFEDSSEEPSDWIEFASRAGDRYSAILSTLGGVMLPETPARVDIVHQIEKLSFRKEGPLHEVSSAYHHPMSGLTLEEAQLAYPTRA